MMKHFKISRYSLLMMILFLVPVSSSAIGVAEDLVRAGMFKTFATSATKALKASDAVLTVNAGEHMMSKEEIDKVVKFQTQFNNYLTNFDNILTYAAEIYAIYYEVDQTGRNLSELKSVALSSPTNIIAVALLRSRNYIYKDVVENGVQIALDIEKLLPLKKDKEKNAKMSEKERLECIGNVRMSLREMNRKIRKMNLLLRYTTLMDCWYDLKGQYYRPKSMHAICKSCQRRWANNASKWKRK